MTDSWIQLLANLIIMKVTSSIYPGVITMELYKLASEIAATMTTKHPVCHPGYHSYR